MLHDSLDKVPQYVVSVDIEVSVGSTAVLRESRKFNAPAPPAGAGRDASRELSQHPARWQPPVALPRFDMCEEASR